MLCACCIRMIDLWNYQFYEMRCLNGKRCHLLPIEMLMQNPVIVIRKSYEGFDLQHSGLVCVMQHYCVCGPVCLCEGVINCATVSMGLALYFLFYRTILTVTFP